MRLWIGETRHFCSYLLVRHWVNKIMTEGVEKAGDNLQIRGWRQSNIQIMQILSAL